MADEDPYAVEMRRRSTVASAAGSNHPMLPNGSAREADQDVISGGTLTPRREEEVLRRAREVLSSLPTAGRREVVYQSTEAAGMSARQREQQQELHSALAHSYQSSITVLQLMVMRIQRVWRGYTCRKAIELIRKQGLSVSDLSTRTVVRSILRTGSTIRRIPGVRHLPAGPYGAWKSFTPDSTAYRIRWWQCVKFYCITRGGCRGFGLLLLALWLLGTTGACYLIPGWIALCLKILFYNGHSTLTVDQIVSWMMLFSLLIGLGIAVSMAFLTIEQERFAKGLDFVLSIAGAKNPRIISREQLMALRTQDLGTTKTALYKDAPLAAVHFLHTIMGVITVFVFNPLLGVINFCAILVMYLVLTLYDRLVLCQIKIQGAVAQREGLFYNRSVKRSADSLQGQQGNNFTRNYHLALSKSLLRMNQSYSRVHGIVFGTSLMLCIATVVFFFYTGGKEVQGQRILPHKLILCIAYFLFTQLSSIAFNYRITSVIFARPHSIRVFKMAWHFRDYSEQRTFREKECAIVAQVEHLKERRVQPRSTFLGVCIALCILLVLIWLSYFGTEKGSLECSTATVNCYRVDGDYNTLDSRMDMSYEFGFFDGCSPVKPVSSVLQQCAYNVARRAMNNDETIVKYTVRVAYLGWRETVRGLSKEYVLQQYQANGKGYSWPCPSLTFYKKPFVDEFWLENWERSGLAHGSAFGIDYDSTQEIFWRENNFRGCYNPQPAPDNSCTAANIVFALRCWCERGRPTDGSFSPNLCL